MKLGLVGVRMALGSSCFLLVLSVSEDQEPRDATRRQSGAENDLFYF